MLKEATLDADADMKVVEPDTAPADQKTLKNKEVKKW